ncbi:MAG: cell division protein FtsA [Lewinellaceae bacterium]|nr:cell division protein FtsA [Lewinellaceae bacterium]
MMETNARKSELVLALDIGTTKVCAIAGRKNEHGKMEILGVGKVNSEGVLRGVVSNIEKTVKAISDAVDIARRSAKTNFDWVHVGIAGQHIKSLQHRGLVVRDNDHTEINQRDIDRLISDMYKLVLPPGDKILHAIPQEYTIDNEQGITDPIGMSGVRLEANFHIITGQITASNNIYRCVERAGLRVANMTLEPIASAMAVLSDEEKEAGVALVDIGGGTTDITIFQEGIIRHTAVIPFGGNVITRDIKDGCTVMMPQAEKLKVRFGSALAEEVYDNRIITIPGLRGRDHKEISEKNLARIIQARVEEVMDYVVWEIRRSGYERKLIAGIVLTGGGSLLNHIDKLSEFHTGYPTRIGIPVEHLAHGYQEQLSSPIFATAIGLLMKGIEDREAGRLHLEEKRLVETEEESLAAHDADDYASNGQANWFDHLFRKTKEWFEAEPDTDI